MIYAYAVEQPEHDWYMQTDKNYFVSLKKIHEKFGSTTCLLSPQFYAVTGRDMVSYLKENCQKSFERLQLFILIRFFSLSFAKSSLIAVF